MTQVRTIEGNVVVAFRPSAAGSRKAAEMPQGTATVETATVLLFTGTRYERLPDPEPAAPDAPIPSGLDLAHS